MAKTHPSYSVGADGVALWGYLDISTAHIEPELLKDLSFDNIQLDGAGYPIAPEIDVWPALIPYPSGFFMPVCRYADADHAEEAKYPDCLKTIRALARTRNAALVRVDADGTIIPQLRNYVEVPLEDLPLQTFTVEFSRQVNILERGSRTIEARTPEEALKLAETSGVPDNMSEIDGTAEFGEMSYELSHDGKVYYA